MLTNQEMQKELKKVDKKLEGTFREVCPTRKRGMVELNKRDIESRMNLLDKEEELSKEENAYLNALKDTRMALSSATKDNIDISIFEAKTKLSIGMYDLKNFS
ncbi:hypothetical protein [Vagococcus carniphilus]|uniref:Uncharacterized protein n=1 Tax=Vagococcus carniphilus TaxID=218144 RepID=A0A430B8B1_9ENTE|nr:hypothetical protein [Vagococcus carniphilus]QNN74131.1 hypothetical protein H9L18_05990 [Vagococcus carniphilus]RSU16562.1 hypothetical protein CBF28_03275 [Vagococcus carniphilus]